MNIVKFERLVSAARLPAANSDLRISVNADGRAKLDVRSNNGVDGWPVPVDVVRPTSARFNTGILIGRTYTDEQEKAFWRRRERQRHDPLRKDILARCFYTE